MNDLRAEKRFLEESIVRGRRRAVEWREAGYCRKAESLEHELDVIEAYYLGYEVRVDKAS